MAQVVVNVFYNAPTDPEAFEDYYHGTHMPIADQIPGLEKAVLLKEPQVEALLAWVNAGGHLIVAIEIGRAHV